MADHRNTTHSLEQKVLNYQRNNLLAAGYAFEAEIHQHCRLRKEYTSYIEGTIHVFRKTTPAATS